MNYQPNPQQPGPYQPQTNYGSGQPSPEGNPVDPYNPYTQPAYPSHMGTSSPQYGPVPTPGPTYTPMPPMGPPPKRPSGKRTVFIIVAVCILLVVSASAIGGALYVTNQNNINATATAQTKNEQATATAQVQATATYLATHFPFSSNLVLDDPLTDNNKGNQWLTDEYCAFQNGTYTDHVLNTKTFAACTATKQNFSDFSFEVTMKNLTGAGGGIAFRSNVSESRYYLFMIYTDGYYSLSKYSKADRMTTIVKGTIANFDAQGPIRLGVTAVGSKIQLFTNGQLLNEANDSTFTTGHVGVVVVNEDSITSAQFTDAKVWQLP